MFRLTIFALAASLATAASANNSAITIVGGSTAHIGYGDLDLQSHTGRASLTGRIRRAADMICTSDTNQMLPLNSPQQECYRTAVASGVSQMRSISAR